MINHFSNPIKGIKKNRRESKIFIEIIKNFFRFSMRFESYTKVSSCSKLVKSVISLNFFNWFKKLLSFLIVKFEAIIWCNTNFPPSWLENHLSYLMMSIRNREIGFFGSNASSSVNIRLISIFLNKFIVILYSINVLSWRLF